jgi:WD40 repeat protein
MSRWRRWSGWSGVVGFVGLLLPLALLGCRGSGGPGPVPGSAGTPPQLADISLPGQPNSLVWSRDGAYIAGGTWDTLGAEGTARGPSEVYVVNVANASVSKTLKLGNWVSGLAFSPDGKWLAVTTRQAVGGDNPPPAELVLYEVPAFTVQFQAKAGSEGGFVDLAWAEDSKTLYALDDPQGVKTQAAVRRWEVPGFAEQPTIRTPQSYAYEAIAVAPDGGTLAVVDATEVAGTHLIRLFDTRSGDEQSSFPFGESRVGVQPRLGFTPDGKALGVDDRGDSLTWWDVKTGQPASPTPARFAAPLAGLCYPLGNQAISPDGTRRALGFDRKARLLFEPEPPGGFGIFIRLTEIASGKNWTWRVGDVYGSGPAVAFSPDGTKLAGTIAFPNGGTLGIWAVPK